MAVNDYPSIHSGATIDTRVSQVATNTADIAALKSRMNSAEAEIDTKADATSVTALSSQIGGVEAKIPSAATTSNKLADKAYVDASTSGLNTRIGNAENAIANKVDKVSGKGLSTNDYTNEEKSKVSSIGNLNNIVGQLEDELDLLVANIKVLYNALGNGAFWGNKPVIDWDGESVPISVSLTNCTISNNAQTIGLGRSYYATLTPATGYILGNATCTMGNTSVPVVSGVIDIDEVTGPITIVAAGANLDSVAYDNKTYRQIFETNNLLGITPGFEDGTLSPLEIVQGTPIITDEDSDSGTYSLKVDCDGVSAYARTSSTYKPACFSALRIKVTTYVAGKFGVQNKDSESVYQESVTDWKTITFHRAALSSGVAVFVGGYNSANGTAYIDTPVVVQDSVFTTAPTLTKFTELYDNYVAIKKLA